jgi:NAD(P)-dependent dehydrogenase (short-subunit alcohol dehydrogenase family)
MVRTMDLRLSGRTAVVTGASKGIGLAVVRALVGEGVDVVAGARHVAGELTELAEQTGESAEPGSVHPVAVDLSTPDGPAALVAAAQDRFGRLDLLVNNVGAARPRTEGFLSVTDDEWIDSLTINLLAAVRAVRAALPLLLASGAGVVVTVNSVNAVLPDPLVIDYSAAKSALASFSKSLSKEFGPRGLRVNTVSPGPVSTSLWLSDDGVAARVAKANGLDPAAVAQGAAAQSVTGRFTRPDEVADLVLMLAGERTANVTGADFVIDGGLTTML